MARRRWVALACLVLLAGAAFVFGQRGCAEKRPLTIVVLTIDTWRRDHADFHAPGWPDTLGLTPRLSRLAREGVRFADARTPVPLTLPAHVTMFSGLPPAATGVRVNAYGRLAGPEDRGFPLLAERLKAAGWRTGAFVSAEPLAAEHGLAQGFEVYDDTRNGDGLESQGYVAARPGPATVERALAWLRSGPAGAPAFLWVHIFEPHAPYLPTYAEDVKTADRVAGQLLDGVAAAGRSDAVFLVTSDHGEMLSELNEQTHGHLLGDAVLRVPFLLRAPGVAPALRNDPVDLADVAPTLAGLAGISWKAPPNPFAGRDLLAGAVPADRIRVAESLFSHQRFRWAQLVAAIDREGTLIDVGKGRARRLPLAPWGGAQTAAVKVETAPQPLLDALAAYKRGEVPARMQAGVTSFEYGASAPAVPFLLPEENGRLPDPYDVISRALTIDNLIAGFRKLRRFPNPQGRAVLEAMLQSLLKDDPDNPEIQFASGLLAEARAAEALKAATPDLERATEEYASAEARYGRAFELGRVDAETLFHWCGVHVGGRERVCLDRLLEMGRRVVWNAPLWALKGKLHRTLKETTEADEACRKARAAGGNARDRSTVERLCTPD